MNTGEAPRKKPGRKPLEVERLLYSVRIQEPLKELIKKVLAPYFIPYMDDRKRKPNGADFAQTKKPFYKYEVFSLALVSLFNDMKFVLGRPEHPIQRQVRDQMLALCKDPDLAELVESYSEQYRLLVQDKKWIRTSIGHPKENALCWVCNFYEDNNGGIQFLTEESLYRFEKGQFHNGVESITAAGWQLANIPSPPNPLAFQDGL